MVTTKGVQSCFKRIQQCSTGDVVTGAPTLTPVQITIRVPRQFGISFSCFWPTKPLRCSATILPLLQAEVMEQYSKELEQAIATGLDDSDEEFEDFIFQGILHGPDSFYLEQRRWQAWGSDTGHTYVHRDCETPRNKLDIGTQKK